MLTPRLAQIMVDADVAALEVEGRHYVDQVAELIASARPPHRRRRHARLEHRRGLATLRAGRRPRRAARARTSTCAMPRPRVPRYRGDARPDVVVHAAAHRRRDRRKLARPLPYLLDNLRIDTSVIEAPSRPASPSYSTSASAAVYPAGGAEPDRRVRAPRPGRSSRRTRATALAKIAGLNAVAYAAARPGCAYRAVAPVEPLRPERRLRPGAGAPDRRRPSARCTRPRERRRPRSRCGATAPRDASSPTRPISRAWLVDAARRARRLARRS